MKFTSWIFSPENRIIGCAFLLGLSGILTIASSQVNAPQPLHFVWRQAGFLCLGMFLLAAARAVDFQKWQKLAPVCFAVFLIFLLCLPFAGYRVHGMSGWFKIGSFTFQPSEVGRPFYLLMLTTLLCPAKEEWKKFSLACLMTACWLLPILAQPDFGTVAVYGLSFALICYLACISFKYLAILPAAAAAAAGYALWSYPYVMRRLTGFISPELDALGSGWHVRQFSLAVARGGFFGSKIGGAVWSNAYLPFSYNDSAGATLLETLGLAGALLPALLAVILIYSILELAVKTGLSPAARIFVSGSSVFIAVQILVHLGINLALLPPSGLVLPFISYGGSSLSGQCIMLGIVLAASREKQLCDKTENI